MVTIGFGAAIVIANAIAIRQVITDEPTDPGTGTSEDVAGIYETFGPEAGSAASVYQGYKAYAASGLTPFDAVKSMFGGNKSSFTINITFTKAETDEMVEGMTGESESGDDSMQGEIMSEFSEDEWVLDEEDDY